jgi:hypothetical protein
MLRLLRLKTVVVLTLCRVDLGWMQWWLRRRGSHPSYACPSCRGLSTETRQRNGAIGTQGRWSLCAGYRFTNPPSSSYGPVAHPEPFFDGSQVILLDAAIVPPATPLDEKGQLAFSELPMYAHERSGRVALARNEVADWYYERTSK